MKIDPSQPIMFDNDTNPGVGAGWWQVNPFAADNREHFEDSQWSAGDGYALRPRTFKILAGCLIAVVGGFMTIGWIAPLL